MPVHTLTGGDPSGQQERRTVAHPGYAPTVVVSSDDPDVVHIIEPVRVGDLTGGGTGDLDGRVSAVEVELAAGIARDTAQAAALVSHQDDTTPHAAYDDLPSLRLLYENGLV